MITIFNQVSDNIYIKNYEIIFDLNCLSHLLHGM